MTCCIRAWRCAWEVAVALLLRGHTLLPPPPHHALGQRLLQLVALGRAPGRVEPEPLGRAQVAPGLLEPLGGEEDVRQVEVRLRQVGVSLLRLAERLDRLGPPAHAACACQCVCAARVCSARVLRACPCACAVRVCSARASARASVQATTAVSAPVEFAQHGADVVVDARLVLALVLERACSALEVGEWG